MTNTRQTRSKVTALLLATMIGAACMAGQPTNTLTGPFRTQQNETLNATVTIKTQQAADSILRQGGIRGIDVSKYQGNINWTQVAGDNVDFAMIRATYGTTSDPYFFTNAANAHANGLKVGAYHYATFHNAETAKAEANYFIDHLKQVDITYPVVLDIEAAKYSKASKSVVTSLARTFMDTVQAAGYNVMLYSYNNFIKDHLDVNSLGGYDLWVANYLEHPSSLDHKMWQHTSYGKVSGISGRVDINIAYADLSIRGSKVRVDKGVSDSIKMTLNERYNAGLPTQGIDLAQMTTAVNRGIQAEINAQWGLNIAVDGALSRDQSGYIASVNFVPGETGGNITYLLQVKLFYKGYYKGHLTSMYDDNTISAVAAFQKDKGLGGNGSLDAATIYALLQ